ncbi:MAG: NADH-quinone oxidoreductase subunit NuoF [Acidimicrobiia bacterium]|nr:NADH-quinone oxidoreductase subunit NuoF [Acidimicrobiia bacterium]
MALKETRIITKRLRENENNHLIDEYIASGGYEIAKKALTLDPAFIIEEVKASGLRGRGGGGFPTGLKWSFLAPDSFPRYLVINADEGEPSTFKDNMLLTNDPHQLVEGIICSAFAIQSNLAFIYLRGELALAYDRVVNAISDARSKGFVGKNIFGSDYDLEIVVHRGAGAYICGEETALIESLEGERGMPRIRPPFPAIAGLYAKPTVVNNVETISTVPHILEMGGAKYGELGVNKSTGTRIFSVSGHVNKPGNYEVELGCTFRQLIDDLAGGIKNNGKIKFFIPGGGSSQWLIGSDEHLDCPLDMDEVGQRFGVMLGSGAIMVYDQSTDPVLVAWRLAKFYAHESCGKCTPCREGTGWLEKVLYRILHNEGRPTDLDMLLDIGDNISPGLNAPFSQTTICPLGPSAVSCIVSLNKFFKDEVLKRISPVNQTVDNEIGSDLASQAQRGTGSNKKVEI